ncbi:MAG: conjugal transfer protein TraR [Firmicutes bacterium]|nr:conjugal transfer protein TraR [Bacillota bacterium]
MSEKNKIRSELETERKKLLELIHDLKAQARLDQPLTGAVGELSAYDNHPGDSGSQLYERSKDFGLVEITRAQLTEVEQALLALEQGKYGFCQNCGRSIDPHRLEALPRTLFCLECKKEMEGGSLKKRPVEEEIMRPPFEPRDGNGKDQGQDAWKLVARYGTSSYTENDDEEEEN